MSTARYRAYFSEDLKQEFCSSIYSTPDGKEVEVTEVFPIHSSDSSMWPDAVYVGEVVRWVRYQKQPVRRKPYAELERTISNRRRW